MRWLLDLLALWVEFVVVCNNEFHAEVGEPGPQHMRYSVLQSAAGYYLGYFCPVCGPHERCTHYTSKDEADMYLDLELKEGIAHYAGV